MKHLLYVVTFTVMVLISCNQDESSSTVSERPELDSVNTEKIKAEEEFSEIYISGTDAGTLFQVYFKLNRFDEMMKMTSNASLQEHGPEEVFDFYKNKLEFAYELGPLLTYIQNPDNTKTLIYNSVIMATEMKTEIVITDEGGMTKIVLPDKLTDYPVVR